MRRLVVLAALVVLVVAGVLAVRWLPWWGIILAAVVIVIVGKIVVGRIVRRLFLAPFRAKGAVLKGATADVHQVSVTEAPVGQSAGNSSPDADGDDGEAEEAAATSVETAAARHHYLLEVTISPQAATGPFGHWEPGELRLVRPESQLRPESDEPADDDDACEISGIQINEESAWKDDEGMKFAGAQRLRMRIAVLPGVQRLKFRYYFEEFGVVELPSTGV